MQYDLIHILYKEHEVFSSRLLSIKVYDNCTEVYLLIEFWFLYISGQFLLSIGEK